MMTKEEVQSYLQEHGEWVTQSNGHFEILMLDGAKVHELVSKINERIEAMTPWREEAEDKRVVGGGSEGESE